MSASPGNVGIIGCGNISGIYLENLKKLPGMKTVAVADLRREAAEAQAKAYGVPKVLSVEQLLADPEVGTVLNLTIPLVHAEITLASLKAGKHVYTEKPLGVTWEQGEQVLKLAKEKGLKVASAPDTFLGAGLQTCRALIDQGLIGKPVAATAFMLCPGHESWHPSPAFYYAKGGGPMLDMGPYYVTALLSLLGPVKRVAGSVSMGRPERLITSQPLNGTKVKVETPTHLAALLDFEAGASATLVTSFDVHHHLHHNIEIYGTEGSLMVPDPNTFGGPVKLRRHDEEKWREMPLTHAWAENSRGLGVADLAAAVNEGREARAGLGLAAHALEVMLSVEASSNAGKHLELKTRCERPAPLPPSSFGASPA